MSLLPLGIAWGLVSVWFLLWAAARARMGPVAEGETRPLLAEPAAACLAEALLLTLVGALWFDSLGHGGWLVLFAVLGALLEVSARFRAGMPRRAAWPTAVGVLLGAARVSAAGWLLAWRLG